MEHDLRLRESLTDGQSTANQVVELKAANAAVVFAEKTSGAKRERKQLNKALAKLAAGDVLVVTRLDWLARNTRIFLTSSRRSMPKADSIDW